MDTDATRTTEPEQTDAPKSVLTDVPVDSHNAALNLMIAFLTVAQKRGAFSIPESAKLWECIGVFTQPQSEPQKQVEDPVIS